MSIEPKIVHKPAFAVIGMAITTTPLASEIPALWGVFAPRIDEVVSIAESDVSYGLMENFDARASTLDYMAAVSVPGIGSVPSGMTAKSIESRSYAVFPATLQTLGAVFGYIFNEWLPRAAFELVPSPYFERYDESFDPSKADSVVEIYMPVKPRGAAEVSEETPSN